MLSESKYLTKPDHLKRGDILLGPGHTAVVLTSQENNQTNLDSAKSFNNAFKGTYKVTAMKLNVRCGAGTGKKILITIPKGLEVTCYGFYTRLTDIDWFYIQFTYNNITYTGFASSKYLVTK